MPASQYASSSSVSLNYRRDRIEHVTTIADIGAMVLCVGDFILGFAQRTNTRLDDTILDAILEVGHFLTDTEGVAQGTTELLRSREYVINASGLIWLPC